MAKTRAELNQRYHDDMIALATAYENRIALLVTEQCASILAGDLPKHCPLCGADTSNASPEQGDEPTCSECGEDQAGHEEIGCTGLGPPDAENDRITAEARPDDC